MYPVSCNKIYSNTHLVSCTNTNHDVTDLVNHGMVKDTKIWISWEQNITSLLNKNILNLCLRWDILKSYRFVAEVTFKRTQTIINLLNPYNDTGKHFKPLLRSIRLILLLVYVTLTKKKSPFIVCSETKSKLLLFVTFCSSYWRTLLKRLYCKIHL